METNKKENVIINYSIDKAIEFAINKFNDTFEKFPKGGKLTNETIKDIIKISVETGYKFSYKDALSKQFSLEDMKKAWEDGADNESDTTSKEIDGKWLDKWTFEEFMKTNYGNK